MFNVRIHGRGGQGAVTAAEMLSVAAFDEGMHAQAFPTFGSERTGAPVVSFCRIDSVPIRIHEPIAVPDALIICDPTLLHQVKVFEGVAPEAYVLINTSHSFAELGIGEFTSASQEGRALAVPATEFARRRLGRPLPNAALLGGFAALTGVVGIGSVLDAIRQRFAGPVGEGNAAAAQDAYEYVLQQKGSLAHA
ncbi:pyruvate ferredoxin oxidoreductase subunit gamma [Microlunatus panaciterrae]|uniref:Pyruvate ferredoxin oxidoreductase gamma subunit n=1 Tax=Microlunatus panaciterrae TaxID=400768 RepID=A0ABS2RKQ1_9ACTN|nr:2-oxoacid:acceptor oxidoreductase family protein [Microlunatus panaciterrae]MBM7799152.1 pyruvate ferredoxin oxidoreductase gamma subunit [Microlunatus panaciterrae]